MPLMDHAAEWIMLLINHVMVGRASVLPFHPSREFNVSSHSLKRAWLPRMSPHNAMQSTSDHDI
jgi:hypothetical protein